MQMPTKALLSTLMAIGFQWQQTHQELHHNISLGRQKLVAQGALLRIKFFQMQIETSFPKKRILKMRQKLTKLEAKVYAIQKLWGALEEKHRRYFYINGAMY